MYMRECKTCGLPVHNRVAVYCSNQCQTEYQYSIYIQKWKVGEISGIRGRKLKPFLVMYVVTYLRKITMHVQYVIGKKLINSQLRFHLK